MYSNEYLQWVKDTRQEGLTGTQAQFAQWRIDNRSTLRIIGGLDGVFASVRYWLKYKAPAIEPVPLPIGTLLVWKHTLKSAFVKIDSEHWGNWRSLEHNLDKPLKDRYGWRYTDKQVLTYYSGIMLFYNP